MFRPSLPVTTWLDAVRAGFLPPVERLWDVCFPAMARSARHRLGPGPGDSEGAALSAFHTFCRGVVRQKFDRLRDRNGLWWLLIKLARRKAIDQHRRDRAAVRGGNRRDPEADLDRFACPAPGPARLAEARDDLAGFMNSLRNDTLRTIAYWDMHGETGEAIATRLGCTRVTVARKLRDIRALHARWTNSDGR